MCKCRTRSHALSLTLFPGSPGSSISTGSSPPYLEQSQAMGDATGLLCLVTGSRENRPPVDFPKAKETQAKPQTGTRVCWGPLSLPRLACGLGCLVGLEEPRDGNPALRSACPFG